jgi:PAS domain S-box-containing protein
MWNISLRAFRTFLWTSVLALCSLPMYGQTADTGAIAGTVSDPSGALVARAVIVVKSQATLELRDLATDAEGNFSVPFLTPGNYDLTVRAPGFEPLVLKGVQVQITELSRLRIQLPIRGAKEQIAVSAKPPLIQTENATLGRVIDHETVVDLPLVDRNFTEILGLTAGTNTDIVDATQLGAGSQEIRTNGARSGDNNFMLNGVDANSYTSNITEVTPFGGAGIAIPAPDTIQEFKVQTSLYDAQYGRGAGANVNVETKSGTADLHGNAYYFGRNVALDANNFFANATGVPRGEFRRSQPGGALGGPLPWSKKRAFSSFPIRPRDVNAASLSSSVRSLSLPPIPLVRTPASLGTVFGGQTGAFGGVAVAPDGSNINPVAFLHGDEPRIEAEATTGHGGAKVSVRQLAITPSDLPKSALDYVIRTRERVVLDDASAANLYSDDEYMPAKRARSVLCLPIVKQSKLIGALYLENNLTPRAFTSDRVAVLELLASQAAISLENARLYSDLRRSEGFLAQGQSISHTGSFGWIVSSGEIYWSEETYTIFEYDRMVKPTLELVFRRIHPDDKDLVQQTIDRAVEARADLDFEHRLFMPDGSVKYLHILARALETSSGDLEYVGAVTDVTAAKRTEETLRESEAYLAEAQRLSHTGSWAWAPATGEIRYCSEECYRVLGFDPHGVQPRFEAFFERTHPDDQPRIAKTLERATRERAGFKFDDRVVYPGGEIRDVHVIGHPVLSPSGDLVEFVGTVMDVTERKRAEKERERLLQVQADLAHLSRVTTMGESTASLAHEIKQPISAAATNAKTCLRWLGRDEPDLPEAREAESRIVKDVTRANDIISRISALVKKATLQRELVDVNELIREMIVLLRSEANRYSIAIGTELAEYLPKVMADRVQLQQVFMNLMLNGIDAMKEMNGGSELAIRSEVGDGQLLISVSDTGVGLPVEQAEQIFKAFFTTKPNGTGMGLRISESIIESHGGRLWAANNSPRGASFYFTLPCAGAAQQIA